MNKFFWSFFILFSFFSQAKDQNVLNLLKDKTFDSQFTLDKFVKKNLASLLPTSAQEHSNLSLAFETKNYEQALKFWSPNFNQTSFAQSSTGRALYAFLLFKNGFLVLGLNKLFKEVNPREVDSLVYNLWKLHTHPDQKIWEYFIQPWSPEWSSFFNEKIAFKLGSKVSLTDGRKYIEHLLNLPVDGEEDKFYVQWSLVLHLIKASDMNSATKIMGFLLKKTKDKERRNVIYLTVARLLYDIGETKVALHYYNLIKDRSYSWLQAQEEKAWIYYNQGNYNQAFTLTSSFRYPMFKNILSAEMVLILSLSQLKTCNYALLSQSLSYFKGRFSEKQSYLQDLLREDSFNKSIQNLVKYYSSPHQDITSFTEIPFLLKNNNYLKNLIRLRQFFFDSQVILEKQKTNTSIGKKLSYSLVQEQNQILKDIEMKIKSIFRKAVQKKLSQIRKTAHTMNLIEAEALYRIHGYHSQQKVSDTKQNQSFSRSGRMITFPFNSREIWLDEISNYQSFVSEGCPKGSYVL